MYCPLPPQFFSEKLKKILKTQFEFEKKETQPYLEKSSTPRFLLAFIGVIHERPFHPVKNEPPPIPIMEL